MQTITTKHNESQLNPEKVPKWLFLILVLAFFSACTSVQVPTEITKTITIQYNPTGSRLDSIDAAKVFFATQGAIEAMLPVKVEVLDPSANVDRSKACEVRFVGFLELLTLDSGYGNKGVARHSGEKMYPCEVLLSDAMTDLGEIRLIFSHELGHIILNQREHSKDPRSIMSNNVQLPGRYRFTESDARGLVGD